MPFALSPPAKNWNYLNRNRIRARIPPSGEGAGVTMNHFEIKPILEGLFFVSDSPVRLETLVEILPESNKEAIVEGIRQIQAEYENPSKGIELTEIAGGYQFRTKPYWAGWVGRLKKVRAIKLSQAALETLAIVAYRQPVIRPAVEEIRGVDSGSVLHTLMEKGLIKMMGRKDLPGRPIVYGTTKAFLELFGLNTLSDLPALKEIEPPPPEAIAKEEILKTETEEIAPHQDLPQGTGEE
jgi:segregation and condensation protein B